MTKTAPRASKAATKSVAKSKAKPETKPETKTAPRRSRTDVAAGDIAKPDSLRRRARSATNTATRARASERAPERREAQPGPAADAPRPRRPPTDARLHARRVAVARSNGQVRLKRLGIGALIVAVAMGGLALVHSSIFGARVITIAGAAETSPASVLATSGLANHPPLIDINSAAMAARLEQLPWVKHAQVTLHWPDGVAVRLTERAPTTFERIARNEVALIDADARVLAVGTSLPNDLVRVQLSTTSVFPGENLLASNKTVIELASSAPASLVSKIDSVRDDINVGLVVELRSHTDVVFGSATNVREKFVSLATLLANGAISRDKSVDLRVPSAPVLTP